MANTGYNRSFERISVRTSVKVVTAVPPHTLYKAWTDALSPAGARILCREEIKEEHLFLQVLIPDLKDHFIEGRRVRENLAFMPSLQGSDRELNTYGVVFTGIREVAEVEALIESVTSA